MPSKIRVLSDHTINKIAAGEVIENPSSVVKELVENSLDAGSTDIVIEIQGGGRQMIRISDNGCGMNSDDALLCLERHATSKLREVEDIHVLMTMGFRGEAIPSIASISKFNLLTCPRQEDEAVPVGTMVIVDGGKIISCHPAARAQGTTIEVKSLFFNVPVRKKFLKSPAIDANEILRIVSLIALGHPEIKFRLVSDGKNLLQVQSSKKTAFKEQLETRIEDVLGQDFGQHAVYIEEQKEEISLKGIVGNPGYTRHNRTGQYLFINKRPVVSPLVAYAVKEGLGTSIPSGRFPVFVLHLEVPGELVDVNVHPQKREVRLRQEQFIKELIIKGVRGSLSHSHSPFSVEVGSSEWKPDATKVFQSEDSPRFENVPETWVFQSKTTSNFSVEKPAIQHFPETEEPFRPVKFAAHVERKPTQFTDSLPLPKVQELPLKVLITIPGYIILDASIHHPFIQKGCKYAERGGMVMIDQKNAHARILFEKLTQSTLNSPIAQQTLLVPYTLELPSHESEALRNGLAALNKMGIQIREFGANTFLVDSIPQMFGNSDIAQLISDIIRDLDRLPAEQTQTLEQEQAKHIAQTATRAAISIQKRLSLLEAQSLTDQLVLCQSPYTCPSGRPTLAQITPDELAKFFQPRG